jgi:DNA-binding LacI/PurR family transcriptional regulator
MNELAVFGAVSELTARRRAIPDDVSVLSIVSSPGVGQMLAPPVTTMHAPGADLGRLGVETLLALLNGAPPTHGPVLLPCTWAPGDSTAPPRPPTS